VDWLAEMFCKLVGEMLLRKRLFSWRAGLVLSSSSSVGRPSEASPDGGPTCLAAASMQHRGTLLQPAWSLIDAGHIEHFPVLPGGCPVRPSHPTTAGKNTMECNTNGVSKRPARRQQFEARGKPPTSRVIISTSNEGTLAKGETAEAEGDMGAMVSFRVCAFVLLSTMAGPAHAVCESALVLSTYNKQLVYNSDWRLADLGDQNAYDQIKHDAGVNAVIYGIPVGTSYSDFKDSISRFRHGHNESLSTSRLLSIAWTGLDPNAASAYKTCLDSAVFLENGLHAAILAATRRDYTILVKWQVPGQATPATVTWTIPRIGIGRNPIPRVFPQGETPITIPRPSAQISLAGGYRGYATEALILDPLPPPPVPGPRVACDFDALHGWLGPHSLSMWWFSLFLRTKEVNVTFKVATNPDDPKSYQPRPGDHPEDRKMATIKTVECTDGGRFFLQTVEPNGNVCTYHGNIVRDKAEVRGNYTCNNGISDKFDSTWGD
jgi:hypothetical protein